MDDEPRGSNRRHQGWHFEADDYRPPQDRAVVTPKGHFSQLTVWPLI
jgi:hypothetical protein